MPPKKQWDWTAKDLRRAQRELAKSRGQIEDTVRGTPAGRDQSRRKRSD